MIDIDNVMNDTAKVRDKMWALWDSMQKGKAKGAEVRNYIAVANVILNGHKVDIAAAHYIGSVPLVLPNPKDKNGKRETRRLTS
jgi:hypothetical protein